MYWFVLFVRTGREHRVEQILKERLDIDSFMPFVPLLESIFKRSGVVKTELKPLFPSYVFIESKVTDQEFINSVTPLVHASRDIICILKYSDTEFAMKESEKQILLALCNDDYCIESSRGLIEGDRIHIIDGPLKGLESIVKKVNRHKSQVWIELEFMGNIRLVSVALEIVSKV